MSIDDSATEALLEELFDQPAMKLLDAHDELADQFALWYLNKISEAYADGYKAGQSDEAYARDNQVGGPEVD